jgi:hypothetical protein
VASSLESYHKSNSLDIPRSNAIRGNATVKIPDPIVLRKFTPATVMIIAAALLVEIFSFRLSISSIEAFATASSAAALQIAGSEDSLDESSYLLSRDVAQL